MSKRIYFVAGEASGDTHGAALMASLHSLDPTLQFIGRGGPKMRALAGNDFIDWSEHSAVLGLWEVLKQYGYFRREFAATLAQIDAAKPDAVGLIDYPGFNLRLARALRKRTAKLKIIYYISPQVWAWNRRRIPQMARSLDLMLCIFPFEADLYNRSGLRTMFVGHPMIETLSAKKTTSAREPNLVGLFPGSRMREVRKILPTMLLAARRIAQDRPAARFEIAAASEKLQREIEHQLPRDLAISVQNQTAASLMQRAQAGIVASGTATLEAAFFGLPFVLVYRVAWLTYFAARVVVKVKHLGMPNVLANHEIVPEFVQHKAQPEPIAREVLRLLDDPRYHSEMLASFEGVIAKLGRGGASETAARAILQDFMSDLEQHVAQLHRGGVIDMHFDLPLGLYWQRARRNVIMQDFLPQFEAGDISLLGAAIYVEDEDLPYALRVALDQIALLNGEIEANPRLMLCRSFADIQRAQKESRIGFILTMEGAEPLGGDLYLLRIFHELGLRAISLTHTRTNAAAAGGVFAPSGSPAIGLTSFGRELVRECERLRIIFDLAHVNPAGFDEICSLTTGPLIVSHSNARCFYDVERNISDAQIRMIGERGGVIGVNAILVSSRRDEATLDRYVDHIEHIAKLIGIDGVGIGFDFCEFLWQQMPTARRQEMEARLTTPCFLPDLTNHSHARNLTRKLIERGFSDSDIEKILRGNWLRILRELL